MTRKALWMIFFAALILTFGLKVAQLGWFDPVLVTWLIRLGFIGKITSVPNV